MTTCSLLHVRVSEQSTTPSHVWRQALEHSTHEDRSSQTLLLAGCVLTCTVLKSLLSRIGEGSAYSSFPFVDGVWGSQPEKVQDKLMLGFRSRSKAYLGTNPAMVAAIDNNFSWFRTHLAAAIVSFD